MKNIIFILLFAFTLILSGCSGGSLSSSTGASGGGGESGLLENTKWLGQNCTEIDGDSSYVIYFEMNDGIQTGA